jgi:hypothetical protein
VGKTELARALAQTLFGPDESLVRIDMSEFQDRHIMSRLIGAPPGYLGHDEPGQLIDAVRGQRGTIGRRDAGATDGQCAAALPSGSSTGSIHRRAGQPCMECVVGRWHRLVWVGSHRSLGVRPGSTVKVVSRYSDHLDLFTTASDGRVMSISWHASTGWASDWFHVSGGVAAPGATVTAVASYPFRLDLFTVRTDNSVHTAWWDERSGWTEWFELPGITCRSDSVVTAVARHSDQLDLFTTASDGRIMSTTWKVRSGWLPDWFYVSGGVASSGFGGDSDRATTTTSICSSLALIIASTVRGGRTPQAGRTGSTCRTE